MAIVQIKTGILRNKPDICLEEILMRTHIVFGASTRLEDVKVLTPHVWKRYVTNWNRLLEDNGILRIRKNLQVETVPVEYFDREIIDRAKRISQEKFHLKSDGFFNAVRLVGEIIGRQKQRIEDGFIEWRIRCLIQRNVFIYQGSLTSMRLYLIKPVNDSID
jgi:hypothetical protein